MVYRYKPKYGHKVTDRTRVPFAPMHERLAAAERMLAEGYAFTHIAARLRLGVHTLARHFPGRGWTREQTYEARRMARALNRIPQSLYATNGERDAR